MAGFPNRTSMQLPFGQKVICFTNAAKFLTAENKLSKDFTELLANPRKARHLPGCLTVEEMERFLEVPDLNTPLGKRDRALFELMYSSGLRVSEICSLPMNSIDTEEGFARICERVQRKKCPCGWTCN